jgi:hypothetical protein
VRLLEFFDDEVEIIPSIVGKQSGIEREGNLRNVGLCVVEVEVLSMP